MNHRHLLPNEIDLLLDGEAGFGVAPLRAHVAECADCRGRLEDAQAVAEMLERLPHFAPSASLADRVMSEVPVFVPWHVAARDAVQVAVERWAPRSRALRAAALAGASVMAALLTAGTLWLLTQSDLLLVTAGVAGDRLRALLVGAVQDVAVALLGAPALAAVERAGTIGLGLAAAGFAGAAALTWLWLRRLAITSSRHGS